MSRTVFDTFTGPAGSLTAHAGETGAAWAAGGTAPAAYALSGTGTAYPTAAGVGPVLASGALPAGDWDVVLVLDPKTLVPGTVTGFGAYRESDRKGYRAGYYYAGPGSGANVWTMQREDATAQTAMGSTAALTPGAGPVTVKLTKRGDGYRLYAAGVLVAGPTADATYTPDRVGVWAFGPAPSATTGMHLAAVAAGDPGASASALTYTLSGPPAGPVGSASRTFTLAWADAAGTETVTITPSAGCTVSAPTVPLTAGSGSAAVTATATTAGTKTLTPTNDGGAADPAAPAYAAAAGAYAVSAAEFGASAAGLGTVTARVEYPDGTFFGAASSYGVTESPAGSGRYRATVFVPTAALGGCVVWQKNDGTGGATAVDFTPALTLLIAEAAIGPTPTPSGGNRHVRSLDDAKLRATVPTVAAGGPRTAPTLGDLS